MTPADLLDGTLYGLSGVALLASGAAFRQRRMHAGRLLAAAGTGLLALDCALAGAWFGAIWNVVLLVILLGHDWWNRRGRKAAKSLGARGRAVIAGLLARLRDAVEPVPEGVPA